MPVGHVDYQAYAQWRGPVFAAVTPVITIASPYHTEEYVTNFASVYLHAKVVSGAGYTIAMTFYTDATKTVLLRTLTWVLAFAPTTLAVIVPAVGNFMALDITTAQAGNQQANVQLAPLNIAPGHEQYIETDANSGSASFSIPSGGNLTFNLASIVKGQGYVHARSQNTTDLNDLSVWSLAEDGSQFEQLAERKAQAGDLDVTFLAPGRPVQVVIANNGAAAHPFAYHAQVIGS
jgi:hypothetical protein